MLVRSIGFFGFWGDFIGNIRPARNLSPSTPPFLQGNRENALNSESVLTFPTPVFRFRKQANKPL